MTFQPNFNDAMKTPCCFGYRVLVLQKTAEKKAEAIEAFKLAARDPKQKDEAQKLIKVALADTPSPVGQSDKK